MKAQLTALLSGLTILCASANLYAVDDDKMETDNGEQLTAALEPYIPAAGNHKSPEVRITVGGSRSTNSDIKLSIFVPVDKFIDKESGTLKWEISKAGNYPVKLVLESSLDDDPLIDEIVQPNAQSGIQFVNLSSFREKPEKNTEYQWTMIVCMSQGCTGGSKDIVARAGVMFQ